MTHISKGKHTQNDINLTVCNVTICDCTYVYLCNIFTVYIFFNEVYCHVLL